MLTGSAQVNGDFSAPPSVIKQAATEGEEGQLTLTPSGGNRYIALNTQDPPFDDINVRKAVIAGSNRTDLRNTRGGELVGPVATHYLPPEFPGFEEAGGLEGTGLDYLANPDGDPEVSAAYFKKAGMSSGKCEGPDCEITMVGDDSPPGSDTAEVFKNQLEEMGFDGQLPEGDARHHVHEVLQRSGERAGCLPERGLAEGLQRRAVDARPDVQR